MRTWEQMSEVERLQCTFSDLHKDVYGFRPRGLMSEEWNSEEWLQAQFQLLVKEAEIVFAEEKRREEEAIESFNRTVDAAVIGSVSRKQVIEQMIEAEGLDKNYGFDREHFCFNNGLPFNYLDETFK